MALSSMTGFARIDGGLGDMTWVIEARSVNGRSLDLKGRYPQGFEALDRLVREAAKTRFARGQISLSLSLNKQSQAPSLKINQELLHLYALSAEDLIKQKRIKPARLDGLLGLRGVIETDNQDSDLSSEALEEALMSDLTKALDALKQARMDEGRALILILKAQLYAIDNSLFQAEALAASQSQAIKDRFEKRLKDLMSTPATPEASAALEERILTEAMVLATKADVQEEIDRLKAHLIAAHGLIDADLSQGRKLDFLAQEFMREANTLCSKSALNELTSLGLDLKSSIDQFREQTQNVE